MQHLKFVVNCALVFSSIGAFAQDSARTVQYHSQDIVPIRAKVKYTTLIELPTTEKIMEAATGDKEFWIVDVVGNFCFVHPAKQGISSNLNLITDKGNIYSFTLQDISALSTTPDLKVIVEPADRSAIVAASGPPQFVPAAQLEQSRQQGEGEEEAFESAIGDQVDGIITFPSRPQVLRPWIRRAARAQIPVVCVATDAPHSGRLGIVAVDTLASGSIAADLMGRFLRGQEGSIAITLFDMAITEHAEKYAAFENTLRSFYPNLHLLKPIEDHDVETEAYNKCRKLFEKCSNVVGVYVTTEASIPVLNAARDTNLLEGLTIITTDLFPDLVPQIRCGAVAATIYQRPRAQGRMAFRMLYEFLGKGESRSHQVALAPHLVMRGNLDFFLHRQSEELATEKKEKADQPQETARDLAGDFG